MPGGLKPTLREGRRWLRRGLFALGGLIVGYWLLTDSFVTRWIVTSRLSSMAGGTVSADSVRISPTGVVILRDATLRTPGVSGPAGEVFRVRRLTASLDLTSVFSSAPVLGTLSLDHPVVRLSRSSIDGSVNIANLAPSISAATRRGGVLSVPELFVSNGSIELGEHTGSDYAMLKQLDVSGKVEQSADDSGASIINFRQATKPDADATGTLVVRGRIAQDGVSLTITGLDLATVTPSNVPGELRDLFRQTSLAGTMPQATVSYLFGGGWESTITLQDVALNLPVEAQPDLDENGKPIPLPADLAGSRLRLEQTSGTLTLSNAGMRGNLHGQIESLPYEVQFQVAGTSPTSPFTCTLISNNLTLTKRPQILRFAPPLVRQRFRDFADPVGTVDARVTIIRDPATSDAASPLRVEGTLQLKGLTAAFHKFPYPWSNLSGTVTFNEREVLIQNLEGSAPSGATISARGRIAPPTDDAGVDLVVTTTAIPIDQTLRAALAARGQEQVYDELFSERQQQRLRAAGLLTEGTFTPGGTANVGVAITRAVGPASEWFDTITIVFPTARVLLDAIPYPLLATDVTIVQKDGVATVSGGSYTGLHGGNVELTAIADLAQLQKTGKFVPDVQAKATGLPIDPLLLFALPAIGRDKQPLGTMLGAMGPTGTVNATAELSLDGSGTTRYDVKADVTGELRPLPGVTGPAIVVRDLHAGVVASDSRVEVRAIGKLQGSDDAPGVPADLKVVVLAPTDGATSVRVDAPSTNLAWPVEHLVRAVAPTAADGIAKMREEHQPTGVADIAAALTITAEGADATTGTVTLMQPRGVHFYEPGVGHARLRESSAGILRVEPTGTIVDLDVAATLVTPPGAGDGREGGEITLAGTLDAGSGDPLAATFTLRDAQLAHPCVRGLVRKFASPALADLIESHDAAGSVDADVKVVPVAGRRDSVATALITPRSLEATRDGVRVQIPSITGSIRVDESGGDFQDLRCLAPQWSLVLDGGWSKRPDGAIFAQTQLTLDAKGLTPDLRAALPPALRSAITGLSVQVAGPLQLPMSPLALGWDRAGELSSVTTAGALTITDAAADLGVKLTRAAGTLDYTYAWSASDGAVPASSSFTLDARLPRVHAANIAMIDAIASITSDPSGEILAPNLRAQVHGGRLTGSLRVAPPPAGPTRPDSPPLARRFNLDVEASNVRFAPVLADLRSATSPATTPSEQDTSRGVLTGSFSLTGATSDRLAEVRRGRGTLQVRGGNVLDLPVLVPLVRATNLELPTQEPLDYAFADFYIQGTQINFEQIAISSKSAGLYGVGVATWPQLALDLRFKAASLNRIPIITPLMESLRQELVLTRVLGTMDKPEITNVTFSATKDALRDLFGDGKSAAQQRLDAIERGVNDAERRARPDAETAIEPEAP